MTMAPVTIPTKDSGAKALLMTPMSFAEPECEMPLESLQAFLGASDLNGVFMADLLSSFLAHERCGYHLYLVAAGTTRMAELRDKYMEFGRETENHIRILEKLITQLGGDPGYVSPAARLVEANDAKMLESRGLFTGTLDPATVELGVLEAVVLAETKDHANWRLLKKLSGDLPEGAMRDAFTVAVDEVEADEDEHLTWASTTWEQMVLAHAKGMLPA